jgi:putative ABC transport system permease protein
VTVYLPTEQFSIGSLFLLAKTTNRPETMLEAVKKEIQNLDPELAAFDIQTMEQRLSASLARRRFSMFLLGVFALIAATLAALGIYGVMAYTVNQRKHEIGIRLALGAQRHQILKLVVRQALLLVALGVLLGLGCSFALTRVMSGLLFGISATDKITFLIPPILLGGIGLLASYFPARRAAQVDPMVALRYE